MYLPRHRSRELDDAYSDVVLLRCQQIMSRYDPEYLSPKTNERVLPISFLCKNVRWYAFEWVLDRKYKKKVPTVSLDIARRDNDSSDASATRPELTYAPDASLRLQVDSILCQLSEQDQQVINWSFLRGNDELEIAKHLGVRRRDVKEMLALAMQRAQSVTDGVKGDQAQWASHGKERE